MFSLELGILIVYYANVASSKVKNYFGWMVKGLYRGGYLFNSKFCDWLGFVGMTVFCLPQFFVRFHTVYVICSPCAIHFFGSPARCLFLLRNTQFYLSKK